MTVMTKDGQTLECLNQTQVDALKNVGWVVKQTAQLDKKVEPTPTADDLSQKRGRPKKG